MFQEDKYGNTTFVIESTYFDKCLFMPPELLQIGNIYHIETICNKVYDGILISKFNKNKQNPYIKFKIINDKNIHAISSNYLSGSFSSIYPIMLIILYALGKQNIYLDADSILMLKTIIN
jgi:hypothetical protein